MYIRNYINSYCVLQFQPCQIIIHLCLVKQNSIFLILVLGMSKQIYKQFRANIPFMLLQLPVYEIILFPQLVDCIHIKFHIPVLIFYRQITRNKSFCQVLIIQMLVKQYMEFFDNTPVHILFLTLLIQVVPYFGQPPRHFSQFTVIYKTIYIGQCHGCFFHICHIKNGLT